MSCQQEQHEDGLLSPKPNNSNNSPRLQIPSPIITKRTRTASTYVYKY